MTRPRRILWKPDLSAGDGPLYRAIVRELAADVAAGRLNPGDRLPTHRELANALGVGLGTVTRAYGQAERSGLIASRVGRGTFVVDAKPGNPLGLPSASLIEMSVDMPLHAFDPDLGAALQKLARRGRADALLRYQNPAGNARHRRAGAAWAERFDVAVGPDGVVVCAGTHHALFVALAACTEPDDVVLCDELCYPGLRAAAEAQHLRLVGIPEESPGAGLSLAAVDAACRRGTVRALYLVPTLHNPTTRCLDAAKRAALAELAKKRDFWIVEDDVHRLACDAPPAPLARLAPERTFYVASFSKAVVPGLRVAFLVPPEERVTACAEAVWATLWMVPPLAVEVAATWIEDGTADDVVAKKRAEAAARQRLFAARFAAHSFEAQPHGPYAWLQLPAPWSSVELALEARQRGLAVTPSTPFLVGPIPAPAAVRVCLAAPDTRAEVERGLVLLSDLLEQGPKRGAGLAPVGIG